jgi:glycosyltransferase involved in cell wall biosynthesis
MLAIDIAKRCPEIPFLLVMNPRDPAEEARVRAAAPPNVTIRDHVPPPEMPALMAASLAMLNTSSLEGFPNTFLQAAAARVPIVSLLVGDRFLAQSGAGVVCHGDIEKAASELRRLRLNTATAETMGYAGRQWVEHHHNAATQAEALRQTLASGVF